MVKGYYKKGVLSLSVLFMVIVASAQCPINQIPAESNAAFTFDNSITAINDSAVIFEVSQSGSFKQVVVMEFDLSVIPKASDISSASLLYSGQLPQAGPGQNIRYHFYQGNGVIDTADYYVTGAIVVDRNYDQNTLPCSGCGFSLYDAPFTQTMPDLQFFRSIIEDTLSPYLGVRIEATSDFTHQIAGIGNLNPDFIKPTIVLNYASPTINICIGDTFSGYTSSGVFLDTISGCTPRILKLHVEPCLWVEDLNDFSQYTSSVWNLNICPNDSFNIAYKASNIVTSPNELFQVQISQDQFNSFIALGNFPAQEGTGVIRDFLPTNIPLPGYYELRLVLLDSLGAQTLFIGTPYWHSFESDLNPLSEVEMDFSEGMAPVIELCPNATIDISAISNWGGPQPIFDWYLNGVLVEANTPTFNLYTDTIPAQSSLKVFMTSSSACVFPDTTSFTQQFLVNNQLPSGCTDFSASNFNPLAECDDGSCQYGSPFITTWNTANPGISDSNQIIIPTFGTGYNYDVYWEDISNNAINGMETNVTGNLTITFPAAGIYRVEISGDFPRIYFNNDGDNHKILTIEQWGNIEWTSMEKAFWGCINLTYNAIDTPNLSGVTSMFSMFNGCISFNGDIVSWDVSNVNNMNSMFSGAALFNQSIGEWELNSNVNLLNMLNNSGLDCANYSATLTGWANNNPNVSGRMLGANNLEYGISAQPARDTLVLNRSWTISGDQFINVDCLPSNLNNTYLFFDTIPTIQGATILTPLKVQNFSGFISGSFTLQFSPNALLWKDYFYNENLIGLILDTTLAGQGIITVNWTSQNGLPLSLPDGYDLLTLTFSVLGQPGSSSSLDFIDVPLPIQFIDSSQNIANTVLLLPGVVKVVQVLNIQGNIQTEYGAAVYQNISIPFYPATQSHFTSAPACACKCLPTSTDIFTGANQYSYVCITYAYDANGIVHVIEWNADCSSVSGKDCLQAAKEVDAPSGNYTLNLPFGISGAIVPFKGPEIDLANGISIADMVIILRDVLNIPSTATLNSAYKIIAADVNFSETISLADVNLINALKLGNITVFPEGKNWVFIKEDFVFQNPSLPFDYPEYIKLNQQATDTSGLDFISLKLGDVNNTYEPFKAKISQFKSQDTIIMTIPQIETSTNSFIQIPVSVSNFIEISGFEFALHWNPDVIRFDSVISAGNGINVFTGEGFINEGLLNVTWFDLSGNIFSLLDDETLFYLSFEVLGSLGDSTVISFGNSPTIEIEFINDEIEIVPFKLINGSVHVSIESSIISYINDEFYVKLYPNPFREHTLLEIFSTYSTMAELTLFDISGKELKKIKSEIDKGLNKIPLQYAIPEGTYVLKVYDMFSGKTLVVVKLLKLNY
ncbi:MAG: BspA family leucine-rich repeat surface protein [Chitinophagaceae bacterium]|nr:MAG: BspA family leucine-rich repeat surface protein [Chitinophagaceae bacterium]